MKRRAGVNAKPLWLYIVGVLVLFYLVLPIIIIIPMSFSGAEYLQFPPQSLSLRWYEEFFTSSKWLRAAANSLTIAVATMLVSTILGTLASIGITSKAMKKGGRFLNMLLLTPMIMPSIIAAIGMYMVYGRSGDIDVSRFRVADADVAIVARRRKAEFVEHARAARGFFAIHILYALEFLLLLHVLDFFGRQFPVHFENLLPIHTNALLLKYVRCYCRGAFLRTPCIFPVFKDGLEREDEDRQRDQH